MIPYAKHHLTDADKRAVQAVLDSDRLTQGPMVERLEAKLCEVSGAKYAVACSSGTAALHLAYLAVGIEPTHSMLMTPVSFVATANMGLLCGATLQFHDTSTTDGLWDIIDYHHPWPITNCQVPVSLGGDPPNWFSTNPSAAPFPAAVTVTVADMCHGPILLPGDADAAVLSFHPCKHVAAGEGGAVLTNDYPLWTKMHSLRDHGRNIVDRKMDILGFNYRLDEMSAVLAFSQLEQYHDNVERRREIAATYTRAFGERVHCVAHSAASARHLYQILVDDRDAVRHNLADRGIGTQVHYHPVIPLQPYYRQRFGYEPGQWPNAERYAARTLSLPLYPTLTDDEIQQVIDAVLEVCT